MGLLSGQEFFPNDASFDVLMISSIKIGFDGAWTHIEEVVGVCFLLMRPSSSNKISWPNYHGDHAIGQ